MPKWIEANGGFFETFKKVAFNGGAVKRAETRAATKQSAKAKQKVIDNLKDGEDADQVLATIRKDSKEAYETKFGGDYDATPVESQQDMKLLGNMAHTEGKSIKNLTEEEFDALYNKADNSRKRSTVAETAKGYWSEPFENLKSEDANTRALATAQLVGRTGMVGGGAALGIGMTHDLFSKREDDTGFGGIVGNTLATTALTGAGAGVVAGVSLLKKL